MLATSTFHDYYDLLEIPHTASQAQIKQAYHRALLRFHPDKRALASSSSDMSIALIKEAYLTLSSPAARARYDYSTVVCTPRPAQLVSLEEFTEANGSWELPCRCGGAYKICDEDMENGVHLVGCASCSEIIWVGYQASEDMPEDHGDDQGPRQGDD